MANIKIVKAKLHRIEAALNNPFQTHLQLVTTRESLILELVADNGLVGYGECVAFSTTWYTEETVESAFETLNLLLEKVIHKTYSHPSEAYESFHYIEGNAMARATIDQAMWDLFAKQEKQPLYKYIGGTNNQIIAGTVVTWQTEEQLLKKIKDAVNVGYKRIKLKITPNSNVEMLKEVVKNHPTVSFYADANGAFSQQTFDRLLQLDEVGFTLIEQPFLKGNEQFSAQAVKKMKTPIALDESIVSYDSVEEMIRMKSATIVVLKQGRVGGFTQALKIVELCKENNIDIWLGGMIEFGISKSFQLTINSLSSIKYIGDFTDSSHYWEEDIITPATIVENGMLTLNDAPGIGVQLNTEILKKYLKNTTVWE